MIRLLGRMSKTGKWLTFLCFLLVVGQVFLDLKLPDYTKDITILISSGSKELAEYFSAGIKMLCCALGSSLLAIVVIFLAAKIAAEFSYSIREQLFSKVMSFGNTEINRYSTASLITRTTNDITQVQMVIAIGMQLIFKAPIMAVWGIVKIFGRNYNLSNLTIIAVLTIVISMGLIMFFVIPKFKLLQSQIDDVNRVARENLNGLKVVHAFNAEKYEEDKFEKVSDTLMKTQMFTQRGMAFLMPVMTLVQSLLALSIYYVGANLIEDIAVPLTGSLSEITLAIGERATLLGDVVTFNSYAVYILMSFIMLLAIIIFIPRASVSANRINEVLENDISVLENICQEENDSIFSGTVEFKNVSFRYPDASKDCLKDINFSVNKGETIAFIGATGSGKSTLVSLIARLYDTTEGKVLVDGKDVRNYKFNDLYNKIGFVPQKATLFSDTVRNNIAFGEAKTDIDDEDILKAIDIAQATEFIKSSSKGLDKQIEQSGTNVSGGQKQRLSIARAIARKPEILIFDDSFSALDYKTDRALRNKIKQELKGTTCMIVAQRIGTIRNADRIVVLDNGCAVGIGTHDELMQNCNVYKEIALSQLSQSEL